MKRRSFFQILGASAAAAKVAPAIAAAPPVTTPATPVITSSFIADGAITSYKIAGATGNAIANYRIPGLSEAVLRRLAEEGSA